MATIEPRLIHLLNKSPSPDKHHHSLHLAHGSLDLPPIEHDANIQPGEQPSQQQIPPLSSINDGIDSITSRPTDRANDPFSLHPLLEDPEPIRSSQQSLTLIDCLDAEATDGSTKKRQQDDFIQLPQPPKKKRSAQQLDLPPIIIGLHSPPEDAGMFPPIKCATGSLQDDDPSADNRSRSQTARRAGFYDELLNLRSRPSDSQSAVGREQQQATVQVEGVPSEKKKATKKRRPWSAAETTALLRGLQRHGKGHWTKILQDPDFSFDRRTPADLKDRFRSILPEELKESRKQVKAASEPSVRTAVPLDMILDVDGAKDDPAKGETDSLKKNSTESSPTHANSSTRKKTGPRPHRVDIEDLRKLGIEGPLKDSGRRKRTAFTEQDDQEILEGLETYGPQWRAIRDDPRFHLQNRKPTDLRDRLRNKYPDRLRQIQERQGNHLGRPSSLLDRPSRSSLLKRPGKLLEPPALATGEEARLHTLANVAPPADRDGRSQSRFTDKEDKEILDALRMHGPQWTTIRNDPTFSLSLRSPADLRERIRTRYPEVFEDLSRATRPGRTEKPRELRVEPPVHGLPMPSKTYPSSSRPSKGTQATKPNENLHAQFPLPVPCSSIAEHMYSDALRGISNFDTVADLPPPVSNFDIATEHSFTGGTDFSRFRQLVDESQPGMSILNAGHLDDSPTNRWFPHSFPYGDEQQTDAAKHSSSGHRGPDTTDVTVQSRHRSERSESPTSRLLALPGQDHGSSSNAETADPPALWKPSDTLESNDPSGAEHQAVRHNLRRPFTWS